MKKDKIIKQKQVRHIMDEKNILIQIYHPFIVQTKAAFQDAKSLYLLMEYVPGGEFFSYLNLKGLLDADETAFFTSQLVLAFDYLHQQNIVYRDLKPENLLIDRHGFIKITDFGFAKKVDFKTYTLCGTPEYLAPEIILNKGHGTGVDWWTLGVLIYETMVGEAPFYADDPMQTYQLIVKNKIIVPKFIGETTRDLIKKLLSTDLTERLGCLKNGVDDIKTHSFYSKIDWENMYNKHVKPIYVPKLTGAADTSNFDPYDEEPVDQDNSGVILENNPFEGYDYVNFDSKV